MEIPDIYIMLLKWLAAIAMTAVTAMVALVALLAAFFGIMAIIEYAVNRRRLRRLKERLRESLSERQGAHETN